MPKTTERISALEGLDVGDDILKEVYASDPDLSPSVPKRTQASPSIPAAPSASDFKIDDDIMAEVLAQDPSLRPMAAKPQNKQGVVDSRNPLDLFNIPDVRSRLAPGARALTNILQIAFPQAVGPL